VSGLVNIVGSIVLNPSSIIIISGTTSFIISNSAMTERSLFKSVITSFNFSWFR